MSFYEELMGITPSQNIWLKGVVTSIEACMYWNGLPIQWGAQDLCDIDKFPTHLTKKNQTKQYYFRLRALDMILETAEKIKKDQMKGTCSNPDKQPYLISPLEFIKYVYARGYDPYDMHALTKDLSEAPESTRIAISEALSKRTVPALASEILNLKGRKPPKCECSKNGKHAACCIYQFAKYAGKALHREQVKACAKKINMDCLLTKGRQATPSEIYKSPTLQTCLKRLRAPLDPDIIISYGSLVLKNWIPQAIGKRGKGRPSIKKAKKTPVDK